MMKMELSLTGKLCDEHNHCYKANNVEFVSALK